MLDNRVMSLPVLNHATLAPLYVISIQHFAQYLVTNFQKSDFGENFWNSLQSVFKDKSTRFLNTSIDELHKNTSYTLDPALVVEEKASLLEAGNFLTAKN
jgi:hypothetical protein